MMVLRVQPNARSMRYLQSLDALCSPRSCAPAPTQVPGRSRTLLAVCLFLITHAIGLAQPVAYQGVPGGAAWQAGDFVAAYEEAIQVDTAAAQLLASRASADQAVYLEVTPATALDWLDKSEDAAHRALALEPPGSLAAAATMALARAKGEAGLHRGALANARLASDLRALFERTLELDPENADALVAYAAWHFALTELGVGWMFGADRDQVLRLMERGVAAAPRQLNLRVEYARVLFGLGHDEEGRKQVEVALSLPVRTAADAFEQARARELLSSP